ncbi:MAG TPA: EamA family transporter [Solirubrobacterales bacterium]
MADPRPTRTAVAFVLGSIVSVQCGAALATTLFDEVGPGGAVLLRSAFAALALAAFARRGLGELRRELRRDVAVFALALAGMNLCFYESLDRLPLGVAVTLEFVGPLGVAVIGTRRRLDAVWGLIAAVGIVLLLSEGSGSGSIDALGAALALTAGGFWGLYILQSARVGRDPGLGGLAAAAALSALIVAPFGLAQGGLELLDPAVLAVGLGAGLLSSAIPYALELEALRRLPNAVFGVLMSLEPAVAAAIGFLALSQSLAALQLVAIALVVIASAGALRTASTPAAPEI